MTRRGQRGLVAALALCLVTQALCYPPRLRRLHKRAAQEDEPNTAELTNKVETDNEIVPAAAEPAPASALVPEPRSTFDDDDDDSDEFESMNTSSTGDGSNIFTLLRIAGALLPSASNGYIIRNIIQQLIKLNRPLPIRRQFILDNIDNEVEIDDTSGLKFPPFQRQEEKSDESSSDSKSESNESETATKDSVENLNGDNSKEESDASDASVDGNDASVDDNDSDYDEEPPGGGDGQGGGILGLLAGLSGGEDGQSDLGSLLATVSGIVANLSGDGIDLNALIASGIGLFVGLLSEGEENPGAVLASYLLTSLDTISCGGSKNNGAFFGTFLSKLIKGTSAVQSEGDAPSPLYTLKLDILRAIVQFGTSLLGLASSAVFSYSG